MIVALAHVNEEDDLYSYCKAKGQINFVMLYVGILGVPLLSGLGIASQAFIQMAASGRK